MGWSRQRRVVMLRRRLAGVMMTQRDADGQLALGFVEIDEERQEAWEYAVLVTSLEAEVLTIGQLYRDRGDCENSFDELKNHWGCKNRSKPAPDFGRKRQVISAESGT
jgi:hypothetical protein